MRQIVKCNFVIESLNHGRFGYNKDYKCSLNKDDCDAKVCVIWQTFEMVKNIEEKFKKSE